MQDVPALSNFFVLKKVISKLFLYICRLKSIHYGRNSEPYLRRRLQVPYER